MRTCQNYHLVRTLPSPPDRRTTKEPLDSRAWTATVATSTYSATTPPPKSSKFGNKTCPGELTQDLYIVTRPNIICCSSHPRLLPAKRRPRLTAATTSKSKKRKTNGSTVNTIPVATQATQGKLVASLIPSPRSASQPSGAQLEQVQEKCNSEGRECF